MVDKIPDSRLLDKIKLPCHKEEDLAHYHLDRLGMVEYQDPSTQHQDSKKSLCLREVIPALSHLDSVANQDLSSLDLDKMEGLCHKAEHLAHCNLVRLGLVADQAQSFLDLDKMEGLCHKAEHLAHCNLVRLGLVVNQDLSSLDLDKVEDSCHKVKDLDHSHLVKLGKVVDQAQSFLDLDKMEDLCHRAKDLDLVKLGLVVCQARSFQCLGKAKDPSNLRVSLDRLLLKKLLKKHQLLSSLYPKLTKNFCLHDIRWKNCFLK